jgi:hypothetical protein
MKNEGNLVSEIVKRLGEHIHAKAKFGIDSLEP